MPGPSESANHLAGQSLLHFDHRTTVFDQGEPNIAWYEVIEGALRLCRYLEDGSRHIVQFAFKGDMFGASGDVYFASAEPLQPVVLRRHLVSAPAGDWAHTPAARALATLEQSLFVLQRQSATQRMAAFIDQLASRIGRGDIIDLPMSRIDIADHLGLTPPTVSRVLGALARLAILETRGHRIRLISRRRLALLGGVEEPPSFSETNAAGRLSELAGAMS